MQTGTDGGLRVPMEKLPKIRADLVYRTDPDDSSRLFVKDPIRRQYYKYNELQVEMMKALDGKRTPEDVAEYLKAQFDADVPPVAIKRFVSRIENNLLLDVSSYTVDSEESRKEILAYLEKKNLALRVKARDGASEEGMRFEAATRELLDGDPCKAVDLLQGVLELNPRNERARQIIEAVHVAYFKSKTAKLSHAKLIHLFNPDPLLRWLNRHFGRYLFSTAGVVLMLLFSLAAIPSMIDVFTSPSLDISVFDFVVATLLAQAANFYHELCHALATKRYGGDVDDIGWMIVYGALPVCYCDTSDSYLFTKTRQKIVVQFAGPIGTLVLVSGLFHMLGLLDPSWPLWNGFAWVAMIHLYSSYVNFVPFIKMDGYYAVSDYLALPNLRERSFEYFNNRLKKRLFGVDSEESGELTPRVRRIYVWYAVLSYVYTFAFIYGIYISWLLPFLISKLGIWGVVIGAVWAFKLVGTKIPAAIYQFGKFLWTNRKQVFTPRRSLAYAVTVAAVVAGLAAPWPLHVDGTMIVEPLHRAEVRVAEPGLVTEVRVREGQAVKAGDIVAVMRDDALIRDRDIAAQELKIATTQLALLKRGARPEEIRLALARTRVGNVRSNVASAAARDEARFAKLDITSKNSADRKLAAAADAGGKARISAADGELATAGARDEEVTAIEANARRWEAQLQALEARVARLEVRSPIDGIIVTRTPHLLTGTLAKVGDPLLEVHDTSMWRVRVQPARGEPLSGLVVGLKVELASVGDPDHKMESTIGELLVARENQTEVSIFTSPIAQEHWRSGMTGQARIYTPSRSVAYRLVVLPIVRLIDFELPAL